MGNIRITIDHELRLVSKCMGWEWQGPIAESGQLTVNEKGWRARKFIRSDLKHPQA